MTPGIGDTIRVAARNLFLGIDEQVNVYHFLILDEAAVPSNSLLLADVAEHLTNAYVHIDELMPNNLEAQDITVYDVTGDAPVGVTNWAAPYVGGGSSGEGLPPGVSAIVLWRTGVKRVVGKTFLPTFIETTQNAGGLLSGALTDITDFAAEMQDNAPHTNGYAFQLVIRSRASGSNRAITSAAPALKLGYQRRRKAGVGS